MHWKPTIVRILIGILGIIVGGVLAMITTFVLIGVEAYSIQTPVHGWSTTQKPEKIGRATGWSPLRKTVMISIKVLCSIDRYRLPKTRSPGS